MKCVCGCYEDEHEASFYAPCTTCGTCEMYVYDADLFDDEDEEYA